MTRLLSLFLSAALILPSVPAPALAGVIKGGGGAPSHGNLTPAQVQSVLQQHYLTKLIDLKPEVATALGIGGHGHRLVVPSPENIQKQIEHFETVEAALALSPKAEPSQEIDRQVMLTVARSQLHELRDRKSWLSDPTAGNAVYDLAQAQIAQMGEGLDAAREWVGLVSRVEYAPLHLDAVQANLREGRKQGRQAYRGHVEKAIAEAKDAAEFFKTEFAAKSQEQVPAQAWLGRRDYIARAGRFAAAAYEAHARFLETEILPHASETYAIGRDEYAWKLKNELGLKETPEDLQAKGRALAEKITARMTELAKQIAPEKTLPELMAELRMDHPADDAALLAKYKEVSDRARDFVVKEGLFAIPNDYRINVIETPKGMRSAIGSAAYFPAPPFDASKKGVFLVSPSAGDAKRLQIHNHSKIPTTVVHEAFPGHDMQFWSFQRAQGIPAARYTLDQAGYAASLNIEGYAHYAEELMRQRGFFTPKEELVQLGAQLWRAWRIALDASIHTGAMTIDEAAKTLVEKAFQAESMAKTEAYRYSRWPTQALTYALGRLQIEELKAAYKKKAGALYSEAEFHRAFLSFGPVPPSMLAPALLESAPTAPKRSLAYRFWHSPIAMTLASMAAAGAFAGGVWQTLGARAGQEFLSTYLIEWTLSLDNLVVLSTILHQIPEKHRQKVLMWGIGGTIALRMLMITAGMGIASANPGVFVLFGAFLATVAAKMFNPKWDVFGLAFKKTKDFAAARFAKKGEAKTEKVPLMQRRPLLMGLLSVIGYDAIFALDSVPAALAISSSVFIIVSANVFSVLGLRSLYALLDELEKKFRHLHFGVAAVLVFVAAKMILGPLIHWHVGPLASLVVIMGLLGAAVLASLKGEAKPGDKH